MAAGILTAGYHRRMEIKQLEQQHTATIRVEHVDDVGRVLGDVLPAIFGHLASQGIKICVDTFVQAGVDDVYRGRVFSLYDVLFNVAFVAAAATAAVVLPPDGRSYPVLGVLAAGYFLTAVAYARTPRPPV